jgi:hypothetical protein
MIDTISNTINNNVYYLGINMGDRNCIIGGMLVVMGLLLLALVIVTIVGIVKWIKDGGIKDLIYKIKNEYKYIFVNIIAGIVFLIILAIASVLVAGIVLFIVSLLGKLAGMC